MIIKSFHSKDYTVYNICCKISCKIKKNKKKKLPEMRQTDEAKTYESCKNWSRNQKME